MPSLLRGVVFALLMAAALAGRPLLATPVADAPAAEPAAAGAEGEEGDGSVYIPAEFFLQYYRPQSDFRDVLAEKVLALRRFLRQRLDALRKEMVDAGYDIAREPPPPPVDVARELAAVENSSAAERARELAARVRAAGAQNADDASGAARDPDDVGVQDATMLGFDMPGVSLATGIPSSRSPVAPQLPLQNASRGLGPFKLLFDVLDWLRDEIWLTILVLSTLALLAWVRQAARRE
jgi:hypothetical protein